MIKFGYGLKRVYYKEQGEIYSIERSALIKWIESYINQDGKIKIETLEPKTVKMRPDIKPLVLDSNPTTWNTTKLIHLYKDLEERKL